MQLNIKREYIHKMPEKDALLKVFKALFAQENRIRALEGKSALTKAKFITALKGL